MIAGIDLSKTRPQIIVLILEALERLGISGSKQEVIRRIAAEGWFAHVYPEDNLPYPSQDEPRWETLIAWARKDAFDGVNAGLLDGTERDCWTLTRSGREALKKIKQSFQEGNHRADTCYMWSQTFKRLIDPHYRPGHDYPRVGSIYEDMEEHVPPQVQHAIQLLRQISREDK